MFSCLYSDIHLICFGKGNTKMKRRSFTDDHVRANWQENVI